MRRSHARWDVCPRRGGSARVQGHGAALECPSADPQQHGKDLVGRPKRKHRERQREGKISDRGTEKRGLEQSVRARTGGSLQRSKQPEHSPTDKEKRHATGHTLFCEDQNERTVRIWNRVRPADGGVGKLRCNYGVLICAHSKERVLPKSSSPCSQEPRRADTVCMSLTRDETVETRSSSTTRTPRMSAATVILRRD